MNSSVGISKTGKHFVPLLFAGDINVYSVARAFHEAYGVKSTAYGKYPTGPCYNSSIINYTANPNAENLDEFKSLVMEFAELNKDKAVVLIGCGDSYVELASLSKGNFPPNVIVPYIDIDLMHTLILKERFYEFCEKSMLDFPETFVHICTNVSGKSTMDFSQNS